MVRDALRWIRMDLEIELLVVEFSALD